MRTRPLALLAAVSFLSLPLADARAATLPPSFQENVVISGRTNPTAIRFGPGGQIFLAEKSGLIWFYDAFGDPSPTQVVDLRNQVHNFWDRGLLGMAIDPGFPARPYLYVLYAHDTWPPGDPRFGDNAQPRWGSVGVSGDPCPSPPGPTGDGCVVYGRLSRITVNPVTMTGSESVLLQGNWCQQYPSHSTGDIVFGEDGYLYLSAGDGASFNFADWGQDGTPVNPCGDPPDGVGGPNSTIAAEGGALRSQDILTPATASDPTSFDGAVLRLDVSGATPVAPATNPLVGNGIADDDFIVAIGLRNPFRINTRPGTQEIWITDVGWNRWEEVNRIQSAAAPVENFGWPCYEGDNSTSAKQSGYQNQTLCRRLYGEVAPPIPAGTALTAPHYAYDHAVKVVPGELCGTGSSSATGIVFNSGGNFPAPYDDAVFFADSSRQCVWTMFAGASGLPDKTQIQPLVSQASGRVVDIQMDASGRLYYVDFDNGNVYRVEHFVANEPPNAVIGANPTSGMAPLLVSFSAAGSSDPEDGTNLLYAWDLDNDGAFDDGSAINASFTYTQTGGHTARLRVTDPDGDADVATTVIAVDNTPPTAVITAPAPSFTWSVGETIAYTLAGTDVQDGALPASQLSLEVLMHHCATPTNCHTHPITTIAGVAAGSFAAPDHEYPSFIELKLTARDLPPANWLGGAAWPVRRKLTFDNSAQSGSLTNFPVLVTLDPSRINYALTQPGGADLRFGDASGNALPYEIEVWNPSGVSRIWVRVPSIAAGSTTGHIFLYYGNPAAADAQNPTAVWSNGYAAVWHFHSNLQDSTANDNDLTNQATTSVAGRFGNGRFFNGTNQWLERASTASLQITGQISLEAWTQLANPSLAAASRVISKKQNWNDAFGYNLEQKPLDANVTTVGSGADYIRADGLSFGTTWHYLTTTASGTTGRVYLDAVDRTTDGTLSALIANSQALNIGRASSTGEYFNGTIDEVRISNVQRSASWVAAQYLSMTDAFITYGIEEAQATLTGTTSLSLQPDTVELTLASLPSGLQVAFGGNTLVTPATRTVIAGSSNSVGALSPQQQGLALYDYASWSDGGAQSHLFTAPATPATLTATFVATAACGDGIDNDGDALTDGSDPGCTAPSDASEKQAGLACDDATDNDGDSLADLDDPGCANPGDSSEQNAAVACDDGSDNDGDAQIDLADFGCSGPTDTTEQSAELVCDDGFDNDGDGLADTADPGCTGVLDTSENGTAACDDGADNDGDGHVDYPADSDCESASDTTELAPPQVPMLPGLAWPLCAAALLAAARRRRAAR